MLSRFNKQDNRPSALTSADSSFASFQKENTGANNKQDEAPKAPNLKPIRVIGNGAFGKYHFRGQQLIYLYFWQNNRELLTFCFCGLGYVFEAIDTNRNCKVALKRTQKAGNVVSREYEVLSLLKGAPNVV
jgi:hypothetical protein